jgi:hypothetical protein
MSPSVTIVSVGQKPDTDASAKYTNHSQEVASTRWYGGITLEIESKERCRRRRANSAATNQKVTAAQAAQYMLNHSQKRDHLMRLTLEAGWHDVHNALARL